jgi:hypothetical protein
MGIDVYAVSSLQADLLLELQINGLQENLRHCGITMWKSIFKLCTNTDICSLEWTEVSTLTVQQFYSDAKRVLQHTQDSFTFEFAINADKNTCASSCEAKWDVIKMCKYLEICSKYNATLWIC